MKILSIQAKNCSKLEFQLSIGMCGILVYKLITSKVAKIVFSLFTLEQRSKKSRLFSNITFNMQNEWFKNLNLKDHLMAALGMWGQVL